MKRGTISLEWLVIIVLVVIGAVILFLILGKLKFGPGIYYAGCEGDIEGTSFFTKDDELLGIRSGRCSIYDGKGKETCESVYPKIEKEYLGEIPFCIWLEEQKIYFDKSSEFISKLDLNGDGFPDRCILNPEISCKDLTQETKPKCQDVPRCIPVSVLKKGIELLKP